MTELGKREMERFALNIPAIVTLRKNGNPNPWTTVSLMTKNVCAGGALMIIDKPFQIGTEVDIELHLAFFAGSTSRERQSHVRVAGHIIRTEPIGMAIKFNDKYKIIPIPKKTVITG